MTEKELRKLNRYQLLEMLILETERANKLQEALAAAEKKLNQMDIRVTALGSIADASLHLNGVFEAAQAAADQYLEEAKRRADQIVADAQDQAHRITGNK